MLSMKIANSNPLLIYNVIQAYLLSTQYDLFKTKHQYDSVETTELIELIDKRKQQC